MDIKHIFKLAIDLTKQNHHQEALKILLQLYSQDKTNIDFLYNIARTYIELNDFENSILFYKKLLKLAPNHTQSHFDISIIYFYQNKFKKWAKHYEQRTNFSAFKTPLPIKYPVHKKDLKKKQTLIFWEQGFGDSINFIKFIKYLDPQYTTILVQQPLLRLFQNSFKNYNFITTLNYKNYDFVIPLMSIPYILKKYNFKPTKAYLKVKKQDIFKPNKKTLNIGIFWQGNHNSSRDKYRSIKFSQLNNLLNLSKYNIHFFSLQKDIKITDKRVANLENITDFYDTASIIKGLDLVISVDSAIAHLAGALGIKTYLLLPTLPDFRWQLNKIDSIFYKSVHIFRQTKQGIWSDVLFTLQQKILKKIQILPKDIIHFRSHSGDDNQPALLRIGDFMAYFIWAYYFKKIEKKYLIFSITEQLPYDFKADILMKNIFDEIYINYKPPIFNYFDPDQIDGLWYATPIIYSKYKNKILPKLNMPKQEVSTFFTTKKNYIIFAPLINAKYNIARNMDKEFVNQFALRLYKQFRDNFFVIVEDDNLIKDKNIQTIKSNNLYDLFYFIKNSKVFIGGDTGFSHFSALIRVPTIITLYGTKYPALHNNKPFNANIMPHTKKTKYYNYILKDNKISKNIQDEIIYMIK